jgi:hypothetical protein
LLALHEPRTYAGLIGALPYQVQDTTPNP